MAAAAAPASWPDNWRDLLAEQMKPGDKAFRTRLDRFAAPGDIGKSWLSFEERVSAGKLKAVAEPLPADATDAQKAEWRKSNGLPETADAYVANLALPDGIVIGDADKPLVGDFAKAMFESGATQAEMNRAVSWFYQTQDRMEAERAEADSQTRVSSEVALRGEWGGDFKANMNAMGAISGLVGGDTWNSILAARGPDGQLLGNSVPFMKAMAQLGRELNPAATLVTPDGDAAKTIETEIAQIEATFRKASSGDHEAHRAYYGSDGRPGLDARHRELIDLQDRMKARGAGK